MSAQCRSTSSIHAGADEVPYRISGNARRRTQDQAWQRDSLPAWTGTLHSPLDPDLAGLNALRSASDCRGLEAEGIESRVARDFLPDQTDEQTHIGVGLLPGHAPGDQLLEGAVGVEQDFASSHGHTLRSVERGPHKFEHDKDAINCHNPGEGPLHWSARPASFRPRSSPCPGCLTIKQHTQHFSDTDQNCSCFVSMIRV